MEKSGRKPKKLKRVGGENGRKNREIKIMKKKVWGKTKKTERVEESERKKKKDREIRQWKKVGGSKENRES